MLIFDAHLDLSMNAMDWNRDYTRPVHEIRAREKGCTDKKDRERGTTSLHALRAGQIGLCVATQIARYVQTSNPLPGWHSPHQAWAQTQGQLAWYRAMEDAGQMVQVRNRATLEKAVSLWSTHPHANAPIYYVLSLEGADSIYDLKVLERSYEQGLRAIGPAHYGPGTYAWGTDSTGPLGPKGRALLKEMQRLGIILDATHLCDESFWEAMEHWNGPVWASHSNCRALVPHNRQFDDNQIKELIRRGAVIGGALDAWMMVPGWIKGQTTPESSGVKLEHLVDHIDHVCQLAGNANHSGIGTDLDGGYGLEQSPRDIDTIADLQRLPNLFRKRGYKEPDIAAILHGNFINFLRRALKD